MAVMSKLGNVKGFVLKVNELHFYLPLTVYFSHEYIPKVIKVCEFYSYMLQTLSGFCHIQKVRDP